MSTLNSIDQYDQVASLAASLTIDQSGALLTPNGFVNENITGDTMAAAVLLDDPIEMGYHKLEAEFIYQYSDQSFGNGGDILVMYLSNEQSWELGHFSVSDQGIDNQVYQPRILCTCAGKIAIMPQILGAVSQMRGCIWNNSV